MKKFIFALSRFAMLVAAIAMVACGGDQGVTDDPTPDPEPEPTPTPELEYKMEATLISAGTSTAEIKLTTLNIGQYAFSVDAAGANTSELTPDIIFALCTNYECKDGENTIIVEDLAPATSYVVTIAGATVQDEFFEQTVKVELTTSNFEKELTVYDVDYDAVSVHLNYPHDKVQKGNVLKWGITEFPLYFSNILDKGFCDAEMLNRNDKALPVLVTDDRTWVFNDDNIIVNDGIDGEPVDLYSPIVPGQPMYFMLGEYAYSGEDIDHWGWGAGYYSPLFDMDNFYKDWAANGYTKIPKQEDYWSGYFHREFIVAKEPSKMSAKPTVTEALTPRGGKITITPSPGIQFYCAGITDPSLQMMILSYLDNKSTYLQWYITSYHAFMSGVSLSYSGTTELNLDDWFADGMKQNTEYTLHIVSMGDENGTRQSYVTHKFKLPEPKKPAPTATVKGIDNPEGANEWNKAWFNVKCASGDAIKVKFICNYEREWEALFNKFLKAGYTMNEAMDMVIGSYGTEFTAAEVAAVNSAEGYNLYFDSRADANTILGVRVMNDEGSISFATGNVRTVKEPHATPITSSLFEDLKGEWTASTTLYYAHWHYCKDDKHSGTHDGCGNKDYNDGQYVVEPEPGEANYMVYALEPITSDVTIGEIGYEQTLPEEVYQFFFEASSLKTKEEVDAVYEQFKTTVDDFNANTRGQNRILCQGFELEVDDDKINCAIPEHNTSLDGKVSTQYASPYDLFIADADTYSAYNYESPIFDFGPKWYFEVGEDGKSLTVPFNTNYFAPMSFWNKFEYHLVGCSNNKSLGNLRDENKNVINGHFPVTISEDKNTITIHPLKHTYSDTDEKGNTITVTEDFYPNIARMNNGQLQFYSRIIAPIVLTRKGTAAPQSANAINPLSVKGGEVKNLYPIKSIVAPKSRTALPATGKEIVAPTRVKFDYTDTEEYKANCIKYNKMRLGRE